MAFQGSALSVVLFVALIQSIDASFYASFFDQECKGLFDRSEWARVDRVSEDCYHLFRDLELYGKVR